MKLNQSFSPPALLVAPLLLMAQGNGVNPADLLKPLADSWPTYNGDYSGKRYSALTQVNRSNVQASDACLDDAGHCRHRRTGNGRRQEASPAKPRR